MKKHFSILFMIASVFAMRVPAIAQSCTAAVCNAASVNESDVLAALPSSGNTNSTVTVNIPSGTGLWTSQLTYTVPAAVTSLIIQGNTAVNCTGTAGTSSYFCSATDATIIQDNYTAANFGLWQINAGGGGASSSIRFTGITLQGGTGVSKSNGLLVVFGPTDNLRIDHDHFDQTTYSRGPGTYAGRLFGSILGVADHNIYDSPSSILTEGFDTSNPYNDTIGWGDGPWASPTPFGTSHLFFIESSIFNGGVGEDCDSGGAFVFRYNSILNGASASANIHNHGTKSTAGRSRACRAYEAYHNYMHNTGAPLNAAVGSSGGASLVWGNSFSGYNNIADIAAPRNDGEESDTNTPSGWGYCGTASINPSTGSPNGVGSNWDANGTGGGPCLDGLGRGQGQALNGQNFPNAANTATGTISWPHQFLEPVYYFNNSFGGGNPLVIADISTQQNRDVYMDNANFTGASGTGSGPLASRPASCTPGPGGTYGSSPTGSYGVAYWATDANSGNGELYVCTASNTWTPVYQPYTYPHPLVGGQQTSGGGAPPAPSGLVATAY